MADRRVARLAAVASVVLCAPEANASVHRAHPEAADVENEPAPIASAQVGISDARWPARSRDAFVLRGSLDLQASTDRSVYLSLLTMTVATAHIASADAASSTSALYVSFGAGARYAGERFGLAANFGYGFTYFGDAATNPRHDSRSGPMFGVFPHVFVYGSKEDAVRIGIGIPFEATFIAPWFTITGAAAFVVL